MGAAQRTPAPERKESGAAETIALPVAKSLSNPCENNREAARSHGQVRAWRAGLAGS